MVRDPFGMTEVLIFGEDGVLVNPRGSFWLLGDGADAASGSDSGIAAVSLLSLPTINLLATIGIFDLVILVTGLILL